jgi:hypothetical protein
VALHDRTAAIIFFGTPLNATKETDFRWAIRACATVELETKSKVAKPDEHESRDLANVLRGLESTDATVVSVYEGQPTQFTDKNCLGFSRRPKIVSIVSSPFSAQFLCSLALSSIHSRCRSRPGHVS